MWPAEKSPEPENLIPVLSSRTYRIGCDSASRAFGSYAAYSRASGSALAVHEVVLLVGVGDASRTVSVVSVHLAGSSDERMAQAEAVSRDFAEADHAVLLTGDFNGRPDDAVLQRLSTDWTILQKEGSGLTFPSNAPDREIDLVMMRSADEFETVQHRVIDEAIASDHRPILAVITIR